MKECVFVSDTPLGRLCTIANKECMNSHVDECDEPKWEYLKCIAEDYVEDKE